MHACSFMHIFLFNSFTACFFLDLCCCTCVTYFERVWTFHCCFSFSVMPVVLLVIYYYYYIITISINSTNNNTEIVKLNLFLHYCSHEISHKSVTSAQFFTMRVCPCQFRFCLCNQFPDPVVIIYTLHPFSSSLPVTSGTVR